MEDWWSKYRVIFPFKNVIYVIHWLFEKEDDMNKIVIYLDTYTSNVSTIWLRILNIIIFICFSRYPTPLPRLEGPLKKNFYLQYAERLFEGKIKGPESFAVDDNGIDFFRI